MRWTLHHNPNAMQHQCITPCSRSERRLRYRGALLLEILIGLSIFIMTAMFVLSGLSSSINAATRTELESKAGDLLVTFDSEIQMGLRELVSAGPESFDTGDDNYDEQLIDWTWEMVVEDIEDLSDIENLSKVEMIIRYREGQPEQIVVRRGRLIWLDPNAPTIEEMAEANEAAKAAAEAAEEAAGGAELPGGVP